MKKMIIKSIYYKAYGKFIEKRLNFQKGINLIYGENEAGKSTVFSSIITLIYGFSPANKSQHPYTHWKKNCLDFSTEIIIDQELFDVERRLMSAPQLNIVNRATQSVQKKRNEPLPWTNNVSERLFSSVFHLTSEDLLGFESASWEQLKERLIQNYGARHVLNPSHVLPQLTQEIHELWRNDRRGNPKISQLNEKIRTLSFEKHELENAYRLIKQKEEELKNLEASEKKCVLEIIELKALKNQLRELIPVRKLQEQAEVLKSILNQPHLDFSMAEALKRLNEAIEECALKMQAVYQRRSQLQEKMKSFTDDMQWLVKQEELIKGMKNHVMDFQYTKKKTEDLEIQLKQKENDLLGKLRTMFPKPPDFNWLTQLDLAALKADVQEYMAYQHDRKINYLYIGTGLVFFTLCVSIWLKSGWLVGTNIFIMLVMIALILSKYKDTKKNKNVSLERIHSYFVHDGFPKYILSDPTFEFFNKMATVFIDVEHVKSMSELIAAEKERAFKYLEEINHALELIEYPLKGDCVTWVKHIEFLLEEALKARGFYKENEFEFKQLEVQYESLSLELESLKATKEAYDRQITSLGDGVYDLGLAKLKALQNASLELNSLVLQLERYGKELSLIEKWDQVYEVSEQGYEALEEKLNERNQAKEDMAISINSIKKDIQLFVQDQHYDHIENERMRYEELLAQCVEQKDKLLVLRELLTYADETFRVKHQPNMMHRVSEIMCKITNGKYKEVLIEESANTLEMYFKTDDGLLPLSLAFSKGTLHQLYFAFRLALIMEIDPEGNLPLVLDEVFVSWDLHRLKSTIQIIEEVSTTRQVFVLTCHNALKEVFPERTHIQI